MAKSVRSLVRSYDEAVAILYQAPYATFVAERKRLAGELKGAGDKDGAVRLGKLTRPSISVWTVNQLWWTAPKSFEALFTSAQRVREGDLGATDALRESIAKLRAQASKLLVDAELAASETTLRRVATTLSALAATGGFEPDVPGQLAADRDPPGFESVGAMECLPTARPPTSTRPSELDQARYTREQKEAKREREEQEARERAAAQERRRLEEERARRRAERERLERSRESLRTELERRTREVERLKTELTEAEQRLEKSRSDISQIQTRLASLREEN